MSEKEMKELDEESVEKVSGGMNLIDKAKDALNDLGAGSKLPKLPKPFVSIKYGAPKINIKK